MTPNKLDSHPPSSLSNTKTSSAAAPAPPPPPPPGIARKKSRRDPDTAAAAAAQKRRCVSTACIACRKRKSKCDGALPSCAACASVYGTECIYDPNSDHRRKGVYKDKLDSVKPGSSTFQILIDAILKASDEEVPNIVRLIRSCDSLDAVADTISSQGLVAAICSNGLNEEVSSAASTANSENMNDYSVEAIVEGERELAQKMGELRIEHDSVRFIGGTSHLIYLGDPNEDVNDEPLSDMGSLDHQDPVLTWSQVTTDKQLITHLLNMYFNWHYPYFTTLSKPLFYRDFLKGKSALDRRGTVYCSSLLVNAMLALGCHFTSVAGAYATSADSRSKGDHFFAEAKRLIIANDEYEKPKLVTVQALALMSVREAGCGREAKGWVYSGMSFRMAQDIGLNLDIPSNENSKMTEHEVDARRITFWGCFLFDKCWSNYLGRLPQIPRSMYNVPKFDVFPGEDSEPWSLYTDAGFDEKTSQPARTRAVALQLSSLCEISSDLLLFFYHPNNISRSRSKTVEIKKLSEVHRQLEEWRKNLPKEFEAKEGQLPNVILMQICTANAGAISKLMRLYKKTWNLRQICNIAVYMIHSACTIHLLNLPDKTAKRDITHGAKHLEEIAEDWLCARRTLGILSVLARKWKCDIPEEAAAIFQRTDEKYGKFSPLDIPSPQSATTVLCGAPPEQYSPTTGTFEAQLSAAAPAAVSSQQNPSINAVAASDFAVNLAPNPISTVATKTKTTTTTTLISTPPLPSQYVNSIQPPPPTTIAATAVPPPPPPPQAVTPTASTITTPTVHPQLPHLPATPSSSMVSTNLSQAPSESSLWAPIPVSQSMSNPMAFQHTYTSSGIPPHNILAASHGPSHHYPHHPHQHPALLQRQISSSSAPPHGIGNVDAQDWFLTDSMRWQRNFAPWGMGVKRADSFESNNSPAGMAPPQPQQQQQQHQQESAGEAGVFLFQSPGGHAAPAQQQQQQQATNPHHQQHMAGHQQNPPTLTQIDDGAYFAGFEGLGASYTNGGWLSGLND